MAKVNVVILRTAGTNCDEETEFAFKKAGARAERIHINRILKNKHLLQDWQILVIPGGFTYGDDVAAGKILANEINAHLAEETRKFVDAGKLVLGICNGFQVLVKMGLLPGFEDSTDQEATLTFNDSGKFEDRWVYLKVVSAKSPFIDDGGIIYLPVAHAEGKFVPGDDDALARLKSQRQVIFQYVDEEGRPAGYPCNPNGSVENIAGICDPTGRVLGLMPHPERYVEPTQHPRWTRQNPEAKGEGDGLIIFLNAVRFFA